MNIGSYLGSLDILFTVKNMKSDSPYCRQGPRPHQRCTWLEATREKHVDVGKTVCHKLNQPTASANAGECNAFRRPQSIGSAQSPEGSQASADRLLHRSEIALRPVDGMIDIMGMQMAP